MTYLDVIALSEYSQELVLLVVDESNVLVTRRDGFHDINDELLAEGSVETPRTARLLQDPIRRSRESVSLGCEDTLFAQDALGCCCE
jgi:hypothetical protein